MDGAHLQGCSVVEQEIVSRDWRDRRNYDQIANLAKMMGLYRFCVVILLSAASEFSMQPLKYQRIFSVPLLPLYGRVIVARKVPLPNYRPDLNDKRPHREVVIPLDCALLPFDKDGGKTESGSEKTEPVILDERQDPLLDQSVMEKVLRMKSIWMCNFRRS
ncbi:hypothetical protein QYE76_067798 [Lolium multiflorum]|uniref:Uncharacterized protein n=1 Tax=Lolium multiflorum TaxID=4521 RepID=A0AAD8SF07_LOLMU|nr:hypothetical protein QYE76_067798 [Lolium multiflorum]